MFRPRKVALVLATGVLLAAAAFAASGALGGTAANIKLVYVQGIAGNPFYTSVTCGAAAEAKKLGASFSFQGPSVWDVTKQTAIVNAAVANKPSAILISVEDPKAMIAPLAQAKSAGIKIITVDGDLADTSVGTTNIQSDNLLGGKLAGQKLGQLIGAKGGSVVAIDNVPGVPISQQRVDGFKQGIKKWPKIHFLGVQYSNNQQAKAASIVTATAAGHKDFAGVFTAETNNSEGAITGLREAGLTNKVKLVGYDTSDPIVAALKAGNMAGDVVQYPRYEGKVAVDSVMAALAGKSVPRNQGAPFVIATPANVNSAKVKQYIYSTHC
jgi:ribose transport system substrate-binding protein